MKKKLPPKIRTLKLLYCANVNGGCQQFVVLSIGYCEKQIGVEQEWKFRFKDLPKAMAATHVGGIF